MVAHTRKFFAARIAAGIIALSFLAGAGAMRTDAGVTLDNRWGIPLDFWVDRVFACHAPKDSTCTAHVQPGEHELQARDDKVVVAREFIAVNAGDNFNYRVEKGYSPNE
jgi:hypothetical protein